ncbi:HNH endonuclease [Devosia neptuniae]|uniref:HNH endonuclease n=1 Tax=Devosia neptuniae TaxID=191302 RepID=UPI0022AE7C73|nr:HNH endonuclease [Devosia neptuniae]MCZ4346444.1 HNH endonuclease [Devosia neptuniae]
MPIFALPLRSNVYVPTYEGLSSPFTSARKYLKSPEELISPGTGRTDRTTFFVEQVERMLAGGNDVAPFCFTDQNGAIRCMDKACVKYVGPDGQRLFEYVLDDHRRIIGLKRPDEVGDAIAQVLSDGSISDTERAQLILARVGQGKFREAVLAKWDGGCAVSGSELVQALRASHIVPWRNASHQERLDPDNGIPLLATIDALFDVGLISFAADGAMLVKAEYHEAISSLSLPSALRTLPTVAMERYLQRHRAAFGFVGE